MEDMRLFKAIIISSSLLLLVNCASNIQTVKETQGAFKELPQPIMLGEKQIWSAPGKLWNVIQFLRFNLDDDEKKMHQSTVYHALNNSKNGEITSWHSRERLAQGKVWALGCPVHLSTDVAWSLRLFITAGRVALI